MANSATVAATPVRPWFSERGRRILWFAVALLTVMLVLVLAVFPTRQYLAQRSERSERQHALTELQTENARLQAVVDSLNSPADIEQLARSEYGLVRPGEETYAILPPRNAGPTVPPIWPFGD